MGPQPYPSFFIISCPKLPTLGISLRVFHLQIKQKFFLQFVCQYSSPTKDLLYMCHVLSKIECSLYGEPAESCIFVSGFFYSLLMHNQCGTVHLAWPLRLLWFHFIFKFAFSLFRGSEESPTKLVATPALPLLWISWVPFHQTLEVYN